MHAPNFFVSLKGSSFHSLLVLLALCSLTSGCALFTATHQQPAEISAATALTGPHQGTVLYRGEKVAVLKPQDVNPNVVVADGNGNIAVIPGKSTPPLNPAYMDAKEIRLKIRELAEQLIANVQEANLHNAVALPVSFVDLNNMEQSSSFGRLIAEQLIYEFNQRGFPVKEYRIPGPIRVNKEQGEQYLSRAVGAISTKGNQVVVAGTYYADRQAVFINARVIRPSDGRVMKTASLVLENNALTRRMLRGTGNISLNTASMQITGSQKNQTPVSSNPIDQGADIH